MVNHALRAKHGLPSLFAIAAALPLILPVPGRCAPCTTEADRCPSCASGHMDLQPSPNTDHQRSCCERNSVSTRTADIDRLHASGTGHDHHCGCSMQPMDRTQAPLKSTTTSPEWNAVVVPGSFDVFTLPTGGAVPVALDAAELRTSIPHRILHCTWII